MVSVTFRLVAFSRRATSGPASRSIFDGSVVGIMLTLSGASAAHPGTATRRQKARTARRGETVIGAAPDRSPEGCAADCTGHLPPMPPATRWKLSATVVAGARRPPLSSGTHTARRAKGMGLNLRLEAESAESHGGNGV